MVSVRLDLVSPDEDHLVALRVYEATTRDGSYAQIDRTTEVGEYPSYITSFLTTEATAADDWFYVGWEDDAGQVEFLSSPVQGGVRSLVEEVSSRVQQRDAGVDLAVATQEAEAAIQSYYGDDADPYVLDVPNYRILSGLVYLTLARCYIFMAATADEGATIGLIKLQGGANVTADVQKLVDRANADLRINTSIVLQMRSIRRWHHHHRIDWVQLP